MNFTFFTPLFPYTPLIPKIWLLILPSSLTTHFLENYLQDLGIRPWWQLLPDKFEYSQYLFAEQCVDITREKSIVYHLWELKD